MCDYVLHRSRCFRKPWRQEGKTRALHNEEVVADMRDKKNPEIRAAIQSIGKSKRSLFTLTILSGNLDAVKWAARVIQNNFDEGKVNLATENSPHKCFSLAKPPVLPVAKRCVKSACSPGSGPINYPHSTPWGVSKGALDLAVTVRRSSRTL